MYSTVTDIIVEFLILIVVILIGVSAINEDE